MARREREKKNDAAEKKRTLRAIFSRRHGTERNALASCRLSASMLDVPWTKTTTDLCLARGTVRKANRPTKSDAGGAGGSGGGGVGTYP